MSSEKLRLVPLGGLGEVGRNLMVYEYGKQALVVDAGLMFPDNDMLGVDYIIPDFTYLASIATQVKGIIITHGHEDHIGAIHHLLQVVQAPIYATPLTRGFLEVKLARNGMLAKADLHTVQAGEKIQVGAFNVEFFHVCHSIPDGVGLGIETPAGLIVHASDYKFDHTPVDNWPSDYAALADFARRGVLALLSDSTNSERPGWTPSERVIDDAFERVFASAKNRIIFASFASLVSRMQQVAVAARRHNRKLAFVGPSMIDNVKMARKLGYLEIPDDTLVTIDQALALPPSQVTIMCTGSQGEPTSILGRLAAGTNRLFDIIPGDTVVLSSHTIPGNEEDVYRTVNSLIRRGADVIYEQVANVHVSGHASQEEIKLLIHLVRPKYFIPIHGELRHLKQSSKLAMQVGIAEENIAIVENGQVLEFTDGVLDLAEMVPAEYVFVDSAGTGGLDPDVMRERETLARDGVMMINLVLDRYSGLPYEEPDVITRGLLMPHAGEAMLAGVRQKVMEVVNKVHTNLKPEIEEAVRSYLYSEHRRKPILFINISRI
ncbi:MAG TPA: ribonuclease J [Anaerolineaceae bacterium]